MMDKMIKSLNDLNWIEKHWKNTFQATLKTWSTFQKI